MINGVDTHIHVYISQVGVTPQVHFIVFSENTGTVKLYKIDGHTLLLLQTEGWYEIIYAWYSNKTPDNINDVL